MLCQIVQKKREEKRIEEEQAAKAQNSKLPVCYDDDDDEDDEESSNSWNDNIISELPPYSAQTHLVNPLTLLIDSLFDEFSGELTLLKSIPPGIDETDCHPEEETHLTNDLCMAEIDLTFNPDDLMPLGIEEDDDESEMDISILDELLNNYSLSLPNNELYFDIPSPSRPPAKPPDGNTRTLNIKMMGDNSEQ
nr:hypothetical protein [Tanacetum cinerariifolium]